MGRIKVRSMLDKNLGTVVEHYVRRYRSDERRELEFYRSRESIEDAIRCAAMALQSNGKRHLHQCRIPEAILVQFCRLLSRKASVISEAAQGEGDWFRSGGPASSSMSQAKRSLAGAASPSARAITQIVKISARGPRLCHTSELCSPIPLMTSPTSFTR